jgi:Cu+-exporting ATPase
LQRVVSQLPDHETQVLRMAAAVESSSEHTLGRAIVEGARAKAIDVPSATGFESDPGLGVWGNVDDRPVHVGNLRLMERYGIDVGDLNAAAERERERGAIAIFVAIERRPAGILVIEDAVKATTPAAIEALRNAGIRVVMLTGDNAHTARAIGSDLGLDEVVADVLPEDKARIVRQLQENGQVVAMAGDGVNDAPALAQADVGIAMGTGTDVAMESAGVTLVGGDLEGIVRAVRLSRRTMGNIRQNLVFAFGYNAIGVPIAAGVLYPAFGVLLSPMIASLAMSLSSVSVISNALRLRATRL